MHLADPRRPRRIVSMASSLVESVSTKHWLAFDEQGTWEQKAEELLEHTAEAAKLKGLATEQVDHELALELGYLALTAMLEFTKKEQARKAEEALRGQLRGKPPRSRKKRRG